MTTVAYLAVSPGGRTEGNADLVASRGHPRPAQADRQRSTPRAPRSARRSVMPVRSPTPAPTRRRRYAPVRFFNPLSMRFAKKASARRHPRHHRRPRRRGAIRHRGRVRRRRDPFGPQLFRQLLPQPADQPARRRVRRLAGEPRQGGPRHRDGGAPRGGEGRHADRGHREADHGRRRARRHHGRRVAADRQVAGGGRRPGRHRAHRGQLAGQPDVPVPRRRADQGVRRRVQAAAAVGHPDDRQEVPARVPVPRGVSCCATPRSSARS